MNKTLGKIHSIESCGTVDGPGIRFVVFTQGCPLRCQYCHNPDSWEYNTDNLMSVEDILKQYDGVKEFCTGGITVTGGEPLVQIDFVTELFKKAQEKGIHTALDTSGLLFTPSNTEKYDELLKSNIADMKNVGGRAAGSASAACFLQRFIDKGRSWAHIDIAGMDGSDGKKAMYPKGASGFGVCLFNALIKLVN